MVNGDRWAVALWAHYLPEVGRGSPFYLAADRQLIFSLFSANRFGSGGVEDALRNFHTSCRSFIVPDGAQPTISRETFENVGGHVISRSICLAVQQVLVVEQMLQDEQYSENAYFPRYRRILGIDGGPQQHSNPLGTLSFQRIWSVLAQELRGAPGATQKTVTFSAGRGPDVNRSLPLSQALFTTHDLLGISLHAPTVDEERRPHRSPGAVPSAARIRQPSAQACCRCILQYATCFEALRTGAVLCRS